MFRTRLVLAVECSVCCVRYCLNGSGLSSDLLKLWRSQELPIAASLAVMRTCVPAFNV